MDDIQLILDLLNETLAAAIVIVAASMLLYNLSRNLRNRVARTSGVVLACVTITYASDVLVSLGPGHGTYEALLRLQWVGVAFIPAAMFHLSDALLATTGLPSRGRRRRVARILYSFATIFMLLATITNALIRPVPHDGRISLQASSLLWLFILFYIMVNGVAFLNVQRARQRCLTRSTQRRMTYLQIAFLMPSISIFPYSVLLSPGQEYSLPSLLLVNVGNLLMILMLLLLAYPLSFFGSHLPDRVVKAELLRFMLLGPATGMLALVVILFTVPATQLLGVPGDAFMPFAVVTSILMWQWAVDIALPWLEKRLIYKDEDDDQLAKIQTLSERLLTRADLLQLMEAVLESVCDYLRVNKAFVATLNGHASEVVRMVGTVDVSNETLLDEPITLPDQSHVTAALHKWQSYWLIPLYSGRITDEAGSPTRIGVMGVEAYADELELLDEDYLTLQRFIRRAERALDDLLLQTEIYAALEGLLPQFSLTRDSAAEVEYRPGRNTAVAEYRLSLNREQIVEQVHAALRHYWGGPGLSSSRLLELRIVNRALQENENNPVRALRDVLNQAIENQHPDGERDMKSPEWTLYNILQLRFVEKRKAHETARRLFMSEANLYRKQSVAIEAVADTLIQMEAELLEGNR